MWPNPQFPAKAQALFFKSQQVQFTIKNQEHSWSRSKAWLFCIKELISLKQQKFLWKNLSYHANFSLANQAIAQ